MAGRGFHAAWLDPVLRVFACLLTSTILEHWVPFPAPGPPNTNTTCGFISSETRFNKLGTFRDTSATQRPNINQRRRSLGQDAEATSAFGSGDQ